MSASIVIPTGAPLCRNPRVVKDATTLAEAGYRVTVLRPVLTEDWAARDREMMANAAYDVCTTADLTKRALPVRAERYLASRGFRVFPSLAPAALGYGVKKTLKMARDLRADLTIGHLEAGLAVVDVLAREGFRTGIDFEDWYSEDLLPEARVYRPVSWLREAENRVLQRGGMVTTTSHALADALGRANSARPPAVVYNVFRWADRDAIDGLAKDRAVGAERRPSLHWVSQTIGPGRGLETLCAALALVDKPLDVHLRGQVTSFDEAWLRRAFPSDRGHTLHLHGFVPPSELLSRIAEHDIGLALEDTWPPNSNLTVSNKMFHYLLGGLAVVATSTKGQGEVAKSVPEAIRTCEPNDPASLAAAIEGWTSDPARLADARAAALAAARQRYCWERQQQTLLDNVAAALEAPVNS